MFRGRRQPPTYRGLHLHASANFESRKVNVCRERRASQPARISASQERTLYRAGRPPTAATTLMKCVHWERLFSATKDTERPCLPPGVTESESRLHASLVPWAARFCYRTVRATSEHGFCVCATVTARTGVLCHQLPPIS